MNRVVLAAAGMFALTQSSLAHAVAQTPAVPKYLTLAFANNDHGWAGGADGIDVTVDGGRSWYPQFRGRRVDQIAIVSHRSIYALADGDVLHTANDGLTWQTVGEPQPSLKALAFSSDRSGLGIGVDALLYATSDGARTWHRATFDKPVDAACFSDKHAGFVGGGVTAPALGAFDGVAATADGGRTWKDAARPPTDGSMGIAGHTLHCTAGAVFDLLDLGPHPGGGAYVLARSTDVGKTWKAVATGGQVAPLPNVAQGPGAEATSMTAYSPRAAYVAAFCGACGTDGRSTFGSTTDAGKTWQNANFDGLGFTSAPVFTSPQHGWIGARKIVGKDHITLDEVLETDDAGQTWTTLYTAH